MPQHVVKNIDELQSKLKQMEEAVGESIKIILEWDDPPKNDLNPRDVASEAFYDWKIDNDDERLPREVGIELANHIFMLERDSCGKIVKNIMERYIPESQAYIALEEAFLSIINRTTNNTKYPRELK